MNQHITDTPQIRRLERSSSDSMVAGVAGGLGRYFELNPAVFRLGFVVLTLLGGAGILVYLAAILVIPVEGSEQSIAAQVLAERRERPWPVVGLGLAGVALVLLLSRGEFAAGAGWIVVLIGGLAILWASRRQKKARRVLIALAALASFVTVAAIVAVVTAFAWFDVSLGDGVGETTYAPASITAVQKSYQLGVGNLKVDLSQVNPSGSTGSRPGSASASSGSSSPAMPTSTSNAHAKVGDVFVLRQHVDGRNVSVQSGSGQFEIDARVGAGRIDVVRAR